MEKRHCRHGHGAPGNRARTFRSSGFLSPYKTLLLQKYRWPVGIYAALLAVNLYAAFFLLTRKLFLKDIGTKLVHLEKQLRDGSIPHELSEQLTRGQ